MKHSSLSKTSLSLMMALCLTGTAYDASAGPLRDRIEERIAERKVIIGNPGQQEAALSSGIVSDDTAPISLTPDNGGFSLDDLGQNDTLKGAITLPGVTKLADLAYGSDPKQKIDVYTPPGASRIAAPILVMVHGGGWFIGDKENSGVITNKGNYWLKKGYVFVSVNYPLVPNSDPLNQANDVAKAIAFVQANARQWNANPNQMVVMGHSAGAHLVTLLGADPARIVKNGARPWQATVSLDTAGTDIPAKMAGQHPKFYDNAFGTKPAYWKITSPIDQLTSKATPFLMICSLQRGDKPCPSNYVFSDKAKSLGVQSVVREENLKHGDINDQLGLPGPYTDLVDRFISNSLSRR